MQRIKELLPIGSVVLLQDAEKTLMITGIRQPGQTDAKEFDYIGLLWPEGSIGPDAQYLFDHDQIAQTLFEGFDNEEREEFLTELEAYYEENLNG